MWFRILGTIDQVEVIAIGSRIHHLERLQKIYGRGRWRKLKGIARVKLRKGQTVRAEIHWYEAHGIGRKELKIKRILV